MKTLIALFGVVLSLSAFGQSPILRTPLTTNRVNSLVGMVTNNALGQVGVTRDGSILTNLAAATAPTDITNATTFSITNTPDWSFWNDPSNYYAKSRFGQLIVSNDFGALVQRAIDTTPSSTLCSTFHFASIYRTYSGTALTGFYPFWVTNTIAVTNGGILFSGEGDNATIIQAAPSLSGSIFRLGKSGTAIAGITKFDHIRFEGQGAAANAVGVHVTDCAEPNFESVEFSQFPLAGLRLSNTNINHWSGIWDSWFVGSGATTSHGILIDQSPVGNCEFMIANCSFDVNGGAGITVSNYFRNISVVGGRAFDGAFSSSGVFLKSYQGEAINISGLSVEGFWKSNSIPIQFMDRAAATNVNSLVTGVNLRQYGTGITSGPTNLVYVGTNVSGVSVVGSNPNGLVVYNPSGGNSNTFHVTKNMITTSGKLGVGTNNISQANQAEVISPDSLSKFRVETNGIVDIEAPRAQMKLEGSNSYANVNLTAYVNDVSSHGFVNSFAARGTKTSPLPILNNDSLLSLRGWSYGLTDWMGGAAAQMDITADENATDTTWSGRIEFFTVPTGGGATVRRMTIKGNGNVGIGAIANPQAVLDVNGDIRASTTITSTNGYSSDGVHFTLMPSNAPANGDVVTATGTGGATKFSAPASAGSPTFGAQFNSVGGNTNLAPFINTTNATLAVTNTLTVGGGTNTINSTNVFEVHGTNGITTISVGKDQTFNSSATVVVNTNTYIGPTNAVAVAGGQFLKLDGGPTGSTGRIIDFQIGNVTKFNVDTNGAIANVGSITTSAGNIEAGADLILDGASSRVSFLNRSKIYAPQDGTISFSTSASQAFTNLLVGAVTGASSMFQSTNWAALVWAGTNRSWLGNPLLTIQGGTNSSKAVDLVVTGAIAATNGISSYATTAAITIPATGLTNTMGINATAILTSTAVSFTVNNRANTVIYTSPTLTTTLSIPLQPGWSIQAASGLSGTLLPF